MFLRVQVSFTRAQVWVEELRKQEGPGIVIALAGNKADLSDLRAVEADVTFSFHFLVIYYSNICSELSFSWPVFPVVIIGYARYPKGKPMEIDGLGFFYGSPLGL